VKKISQGQARQYRDELARLRAEILDHRGVLIDNTRMSNNESIRCRTAILLGYTLVLRKTIESDVFNIHAIKI